MFIVTAFPLGKCSTAWRQWGIRFVKMTKQKSENEFSMSDLQVISCGSYMTGEQRHDCREFVWTLFKTKDEWDGSSKWKSGSRTFLGQDERRGCGVCFRGIVRFSLPRFLVLREMEFMKADLSDIWYVWVVPKIHTATSKIKWKMANFFVRPWSRS